MSEKSAANVDESWTYAEMIAFLLFMRAIESKSLFDRPHRSGKLFSGKSRQHGSKVKILNWVHFAQPFKC